MSSSKHGPKLTIQGHVTIIDEKTGEILLDQHNAIHEQNMARIIARTLANEPNSSIFRMAFGNGGSFRDPTTNGIVLNPPNDGDSDGLGWESRLYNEIYGEVVDTREAAFANDLGSAEFDRVRIGGGDVSGDDLPEPLGTYNTEIGVISKIGVDMLLNSREPIGEDPFTFDEIALFSEGGGASASPAVASIDVGTLDSQNKIPLGDIGWGQQYLIMVEVNGITYTEIILTPDLPPLSPAGFKLTYGDFCQGVNDSTWFQSGDNLADIVHFFISDDTQALYPSIEGEKSWGFLSARTIETGEGVTIAFPEVKKVGSIFNALWKLGGNDWANLNLNVTTGKNRGNQNNPVNADDERERLLTHLTFTPIEKPAGDALRVVYILTIGVNENEVTAVVPPIVEISNTPLPSLDPTSTPTVTPTTTATVTPTLTPTITPSATDPGGVILTDFAYTVVDDVANQPTFVVTFTSDGQLIYDFAELASLPQTSPITIPNSWYDSPVPVPGVGDDYQVNLTIEAFGQPVSDSGFITRFFGTNVGSWRALTVDRSWGWNANGVIPEIGSVQAEITLRNRNTLEILAVLELTITFDTLTHTAIDPAIPGFPSSFDYIHVQTEYNASAIYSFFISPNGTGQDRRWAIEYNQISNFDWHPTPAPGIGAGYICRLDSANLISSTHAGDYDSAFPVAGTEWNLANETAGFDVRISRLPIDNYGHVHSEFTLTIRAAANPSLVLSTITLNVYLSLTQGLGGVRLTDFVELVEADYDEEASFLMSFRGNGTILYQSVPEWLSPTDFQFRGEEWWDQTFSVGGGNSEYVVALDSIIYSNITDLVVTGPTVGQVFALTELPFTSADYLFTSPANSPEGTRTVDAVFSIRHNSTPGVIIDTMPFHIDIVKGPPIGNVVLSDMTKTVTDDWNLGRSFTITFTNDGRVRWRNTTTQPLYTNVQGEWWNDGQLLTPGVGNGFVVELDSLR